MYSKYYDISTIILQVHYGIVPRMAAALPRWVVIIGTIDCEKHAILEQTLFKDYGWFGCAGI